MLVEMLRNHSVFETFTLEQQEVFARLATVFEQDHANLFRSPEELTRSTQLGNRFLWANFLALEPVQQYIKAQIAQSLQIMQRKTLQALQEQAQKGDVQAIKQIQFLAGIMEQQDNNKIIVLHQISRPPKVQMNGGD